MEQRKNKEGGEWSLRKSLVGRNALMGIAVLLIMINVIFNFGWFFKQSSPKAIVERRSFVGPYSDKWIVITSIGNVTDDIRRLALLEGWKIVVVGDKKSPSVWQHPNCTFLNLKSQTELQFEIHDHLPFNSYARKTLGYLYAIEHGAKFIYDTDDDNKPLRDRLDFDFGETRPGIRAESATTPDEAVYWNAYSHFGRPDVWPRGFPLQQIQDKNPKIQFRLYDRLKPGAIQQGLVNRDPDVDAVYRLVTYADQMPGANSESNRIWFDPSAPAVQLGPGVYTPFNSQNTLFRYEAFWALYIPVSTSFRVCDIWRGYWALRLLTEIDEALDFHPANAVQFRNAHNYFHDFLDERALYEQANSLVEHLHSWSCTNRTFEECALHLAQTMSVNGFWTQKDVRGIEIWFKNLKQLGYIFPQLRRRSVVDSDHLRGSVSFASTGEQSEDKNYDRFQRIQKISKLCRSKISPIADSPSATKPFSDSWQRRLKKMALVVVFNQPFNGNIPLLQTLYDAWFANTVFCSRFPQNPLQFGKSRAAPDFDSTPKSFSYVNVSTEEMEYGIFGHACLTRTMEMGMNVDGYLVIGDDVLFNFWTPFDDERLNFVSDEHSEENSTNPHTIDFWQGPIGRSGIESIKSDSKFLSQLDEKTRNALLETLSKETSCNADVYYVPKNRERDFLMLANRFLKANVFLEIAIPKIYTALGWDSKNDPVLLGSYLWREDRPRTLSFFNSSDHYLHPVKMSLLKEESWRNDFCSTYGKVWLEKVYETLEL